MSKPTKNTITGAIALHPADNQQGGYYFYSLASGRRLLRNHCTRLPMPEEVIARVHGLSRRARAKLGLIFKFSKTELVPDLINDSDIDSNSDDDTYTDGSSESSDNSSFSDDSDSSSSNDSLSSSPSSVSAATQQSRDPKGVGPYMRPRKQQRNNVDHEHDNKTSNNGSDDPADNNDGHDENEHAEDDNEDKNDDEYAHCTMPNYA